MFNSHSTLSELNTVVHADFRRTNIVRPYEVSGTKRWPGIRQYRGLSTSPSQQDAGMWRSVDEVSWRIPRLK